MHFAGMALREARAAVTEVIATISSGYFQFAPLRCLHEFSNAEFGWVSCYISVRKDDGRYNTAVLSFVVAQVVVILL